MSTSQECAGGCRCQTVRFVCRGKPKFVARCHCDSCRRSTGGAFSTWVGWREDQVSVPGPMSHHAPSPGVSRGFCGRCGTPLSYQGEAWAGEIHFLIGAYDDPTAFTPSGDAFAGEALDWCRPDPD